MASTRSSMKGYERCRFLKIADDFVPLERPSINACS